jgi:light-regulated signal transduction histidine kinase (bacteriophytochrome)
VTDTALDLTACDREPIHIPGAIQPHGLLLVADAASLRVVAGAGDIETRLTPDWLGKDLAMLIGQDVVALLAERSGRGSMIGAAVGTLVAGTSEQFHMVLHASEEHVLVELEPATTAPSSAATVLGWLDSMATAFERSGSLQALCEQAAVAFRTLTGFDRVMVYRFLDDESGRVMAEDRDPTLHSFLNHHFPATDIPKQARALYVRNRTRAIPHAVYTPAILRPAGFETLDLSDVALRSVSPIHLRYMTNMGVAASASISIVKDGLLWGMIACHSMTPRTLAPDIRATASTLASSLARQIRAKEEAEGYRERLRLRSAEDVVVLKMASEGSAQRTAAAVGDDLRRMLASDGFALVQHGAVQCEGHCPGESEVLDLVEWIRNRGTADVVATHALSTLYPPAERYRSKASGVLAMPLIDEGAVLLWFRAERITEIEWAGNPHKATSGDPAEQLTPRTSFASWTEEVRGESRRWSLEEIEAGYRLRRMFHDSYASNRMRALNRELQRTLAEKDLLIEQKDVLMKEVNHRVQNSLQMVSAFLALQAKAAGDANVTAHLAEAQARLSAVALVHRRLYRDDQVQSVDLARYLEELAGDMKGTLGQEWAAQMRLDLAPVLMPTDRAVNVGLILTELVINASKYAYGGQPGPILIALEQYRNQIRLIVADKGVGQTGTRVGFGSRMMNAVVGRLSGSIAQQDNMPGLRVIMTAPIED